MVSLNVIAKKASRKIIYRARGFNESLGFKTVHLLNSLFKNL